MKEKDKKKILEDGDGTNKRDFLKALGAGLGIAGLGSMTGGQSFAEEKKGKYVIVITHGGDDPNRAILGLLLAQTVG
jgi:hypothetical protein